MPLISVLIPVYNVENYIEKCLLSLFSNSCLDEIEFIILNDCSTDNSMEIVRNYYKKYNYLDIKIFENEHNEGIHKTRHNLIKKANGNYILFIDSDDWVESTLISDILKIIKEKSPDIISFGYFLETKNKCKIFKNPEIIDVDSFISHIIRDNIGAYLWSKVLKKEIINTNKLDFTCCSNIQEDFHFISNYLLYTNNIYNHNKSLYHYRFINNNSLVHQESIKLWNDIFDVLNQIKEIYTKKDLFNKYENDFYYRYLSNKMLFSMKYIFTKKNFIKLFSKEDVIFLKQNIKTFTIPKRIYIYLLYKRKFFLLTALTLLNAIKKQKFYGFINKKINDIDFLYSF